MRATPPPGTGAAASGAGLLPVFLTVFIDLLGFGIVIPLLPIYSQAFGASELVLGLLFSSFSLMQLVFAPFWGRLSDRVGRKPVLVGGLVGTCLSYLLFGFADGLPLLFLSRMLAGFFGANVATAQAYVADVTSARDRAKGMGMIGAAFGLGFTFGPLIGGEAVRWSMGAPGFVAAGLSALAALIGWARLVEPERHRASERGLLSLSTTRGALSDPRVGTVLGLYFLAILSFSGFESMFIRFGLERFPTTFGIPAATSEATMEQILSAAPIAGRYMFFIGLVSAVIQGGLIRRLAPRFGEVRLIVIGPLLLGSAFAIIGLAPTWTWVLVGCALMPFGFGLNNPSLHSLLSRAVPDSEQGAYLGLNQSLGSAARVVGPVLAGALFSAGHPALPFFVSAALLGAATVIAFGYARRHGDSFEHGASTLADGPAAH